jgi:hypothetical protein
VLPFWISIAVLSLSQGAVVAVPRALRAGRLARLHDRRWAALPPVSVIAFVFIAGAAERASTQGLTYLALIAVPMLAALALGWLTWDAGAAHPVRIVLVPALFVLAWVDRGGLAGQLAALILSALSCVALGALLAALTPPRWLALGILAMAIADTVLVISDLLQRPNDALNAAHPAAGLPRLQSAVVGSAVMGYGDLFVAGALGGLLAVALGHRSQLQGAVLTALLALGFDLLFLFVSELPATVPVALALIVLLLRRRRQDAPSRSAPRAGRGVAAGPRGGRAPAAR